MLCYDNASQDGSADIAARAGSEVIRSSTNDGFPRAVNSLLPRVESRLVLLLNPDVTLNRDALTKSMRELDDPNVGLVGANLRRPDGRPDPPAARRFRTVGTILLESLGFTRLWRRLDVQYYPRWDRSESRDVACINGAYMLLRTADLRDLGGLDESVFLYLEDQVLCDQIARGGRRVRFAADAIAHHVGGGPTEASSPERRAAAYLHRLDASLEIVRLRQGQHARRAATLVLMLRCSALYGLSRAQRNTDGVLKYGSGIRWLNGQWRSRRPPPPVP